MRCKGKKGMKKSEVNVKSFLVIFLAQNKIGGTSEKKERNREKEKVEK